MSTFVLVHGAWHGGWCWDVVAERLRSAGHTVLAPTLTGLGDRGGELTESIGLEDHTRQIADLLRERPDRELTVVGHSYSGLVVREAVDCAPSSVRRVILVDGWAGRDGDSLLSLAPAWFALGIHSLVEGADGGWRIAPPPPALVGIDDPETASWLSKRLTPQSLKTFTEPTQLSGAIDAISGTAVICERSGGLPFEDFARRLGYTIKKIDTGHDAMLTEPAQLATILEEAASDPPAS